MRNLWPFWILGLTIKVVGACWDVAWHFQRLNDRYSPAHTTNIIGDVILAATLFMAWRSRRPQTQGPLNWILFGFLVAGVAIPSDLAWHEIFGLDLTTWSPTHLLLFSGTVWMCLGVMLLWAKERGWRWGQKLAMTPGRTLMLGLLGAFLLDAIAFPATFQEYAVVGAANRDAGYAWFDIWPDLKEHMAPFADPARGDLPPALYPAFTLAAATFVAVFVRRFTDKFGAATLATGFYVLERVIANAILARTGWPWTAIPYHYLLAGFAVDLVFQMRAGVMTRGALAAPAATGVAYGYWLKAGDYVFVVAVPLGTLLWGLVGALFGVLMALDGADWLHRRLAPMARDFTPKWATRIVGPGEALQA